jgi:hypothetical protein
MTETEKVEATNGNSEHKGAVTGLDKDIIKQVAYYLATSICLETSSSKKN